jgi:prefoldin subunit 5
MFKFWLRNRLNNIKNLINWPWKQIKKVWAWIVQDPRNILTIVNLLLVIYALRLSIQNANVSSHFQKSVVQNLTRITQLSDSLRNSLDALPRSIESFGTSIKGLNSVIEEQQIALNKSIGSLNENVDEFSKSLLSYKANLTKIVETTEKQIELLKKTQAQWEEEISRVPQLSLEIDSIESISSDTLFIRFSLLNKGNQIGKVSGIILLIPTDYQFIAENWILSESDKRFNQYSLDKVPLAPFSSDPKNLPAVSNKFFKFRLIKHINSKFPHTISYNVYEERIGLQTGELKLNISK